MPTYNILTLDGGGSWAILEAMALGELYGYNTPGQQILNKFTLAASNSGGSIILAGLAVNFSPQDLIDRLNNQTLRNSIFVKNHNLETALGLERYDASKKLPALQAVLGQAPCGSNADLPLNQVSLLTTVPNPPCKLLICAFNYDRLRAEFFRSDVNSPAASAKGSAQPTLAEAVHASSNAPVVYFDAPAEFKSPAFAGCRYWDGAMGGFNNPLMAAVTEMLAYGYAASDLRVLSLGTGNVFLPMPSPIPAPDASGQNNLCVNIVSSGTIHDAKLAAATILDDPPDSASYTAHLLTSGTLSQDPAKPITNGNVVRLNPWIQPISTPAGWAAPSLIPFAPDPKNNTIQAKYSTDAAAFAALVNLDMDAIDQADVDLITTLGRSWIKGAAPNQAIRATSKMQPLIGHSNFAAAKSQAQALGLL